MNNMNKKAVCCQKKGILLILTLVLTFALTACSSGSDDVAKAASGDADYLGTYTETTYRNERFGLLFTAPTKDFEFAMMDDILTANNIKEDDFSNTRVPEILAEGQDYMVMYGGDKTAKTSTSVVISPSSKGIEPETFVQNTADQIKASLEADTSITVKECELKTGSPIGYDKYLVYTIQSNQSIFYTEQFFSFTDINVASITISSDSTGQIKTMHGAWRKLN